MQVIIVDNKSQLIIDVRELSFSSHIIVLVDKWAKEIVLMRKKEFHLPLYIGIMIFGGNKQRTFSSNEFNFTSANKAGIMVFDYEITTRLTQLSKEYDVFAFTDIKAAFLFIAEKVEEFENE